MWTKIRQQEEPKKTLAKRGIKKIDTIVTAMVLGGIIASIYGFQKSKTQKESDLTPEGEEKHSIGSILKLLLLGVDHEEKSASLWQKIRDRFR